MNYSARAPAYDVTENLHRLYAETRKSYQRSDRSMRAQRRNPNTETTRKAIADYNAYSASLTAYNDAMDAARREAYPVTA